MKKLLFALFCLLTFPVMASHIVGGEFELIYLPGLNFSYRLNLILYFDENNGSQDAKDQNIKASIYRKRDNVFMRSVDFSGFTPTPVSYTQPSCSQGEIRTSKLTYTTLLTLPSNLYGDPGGYYIIWERCCRNYSITNIQSNAPATGQTAGQTFYLEFPPVIKNGQPFINSSPRLFPPLNDYACPLKPYYVDFAGVDDDGDRLVYSLVTPLSTHSSEATPPPEPAPYPLVQWRNPFSLSNILNGSPDLKISPDGFLTATPRNQGLYVFAVKCEEFRNGVKIGEVRRDFQMMVLDHCGVAEPPKILGKKLTDLTFAYDKTMNVTFANGIVDADRCIQVQVSDLDALRSADNFQEKISIRAIPLNFKKDITGILPAITNAVLTNGSTQTFDICFDECPYVEGPFQIGIVAYDDACSQPLTDTLKINVNIIPPPNQKPYFTTADVQETLLEDQVKTWSIVGIDDDGDQLIDAVIPNGFRLQDFGMKFDLIQNLNGAYDAKLTWDTHCLNYDFSERTVFDLKIIIKDIDDCMFQHPDTMIFNLDVKRLETDPVIDSDLTTNAQEREVNITKTMFETLSFNVTGKQADNRFLVLNGQGIGFDFKDYSMSFESVTGNGIVTSPFLWNITCDNVNLTKKDTFDLQFIVVDDASKCRIYKADTLDVHVVVKPSINLKPLLTISSIDQNVPVVENSVSIKLGQRISLALNGNDFNTPKDPVKINLIDASGNVNPAGYEFVPIEGLGHAQAEFSWFPDCSIFVNDVYKNDYIFTFNVTDDRCKDIKGDTVAINISIEDVDQETTDFIPPNVVTADNNELNDFFAMMMVDENSTGETPGLINILPKDNCKGHFVSITIYNRWGKEIFTSTNRDFKWFPNGEAAGVYFYYLNFTDKVYKGSVSVRY